MHAAIELSETRQVKFNYISQAEIHNPFFLQCFLFNQFCGRFLTGQSQLISFSEYCQMLYLRQPSFCQLYGSCLRMACRKVESAETEEGDKLERNLEGRVSHLVSSSMLKVFYCRWMYSSAYLC